MNPKIEEWAREQFESVNLGDERLNKRAQIIACNMNELPHRKRWGIKLDNFSMFGFYPSYLDYLRISSSVQVQQPAQ